MPRQFNTGAAPHMPAIPTMAVVMRQVLYALIPGIAAYVWYFGIGVLVQILVACAFALLFEYLMLKARRQPIKLYLTDGSALVTAVLFSLCIPPLTPWWIVCIAMFFAIVVAKHLYGGLGQNVFNPAMVGYVVVLISFPQALTQWLPPQSLAQYSLSFTDVLYTIFTGHLPLSMTWDTISQATPLDTLKTGVAANQMVNEIRQSPIFGSFGGLGWEWIANWYAVGGFYLLYKRIISWHVPVAMIGSVVLLSLPVYLLDSGNSPVPLQHVFSGALVLGAFFIATDPVSGCTTTKGRLIFGCAVGIITLVIRRWGGYPDGVAFGVLLMNLAAPLIDRYTRPRAYGERKGSG